MKILWSDQKNSISLGAMIPGNCFFSEDEILYMATSDVNSVTGEMYCVQMSNGEPNSFNVSVSVTPVKTELTILK